MPQELFLPRADQKCIFCRNKPAEPAWCLLCGAVMCCQDRRCSPVSAAAPGIHQRASPSSKTGHMHALDPHHDTRTASSLDPNAERALSHLVAVMACSWST